MASSLESRAGVAPEKRVAVAQSCEAIRIDDGRRRFIHRRVFDRVVVAAHITRAVPSASARA